MKTVRLTVRLAVLLLVTGCVSGTTHIGQAVNVYTDTLSHYNTLCRPEVLPPGFKTSDRCRSLYTLLLKTKSDIAAANQALKLGGKTSPQRVALDKDVVDLQKEKF